MVAALSAYFGVVSLVSAGYAMHYGAGRSVVGYVEVLVTVLVASLCFALAWSLIQSTRR